MYDSEAELFDFSDIFSDGDWSSLYSSQNLESSEAELIHLRNSGCHEFWERLVVY